jgi:hypothetical protein
MLYEQLEDYSDEALLLRVQLQLQVQVRRRAAAQLLGCYESSGLPEWLMERLQSGAVVQHPLLVPGMLRGLMNSLEAVNEQPDAAA